MKHAIVYWRDEFPDGRVGPLQSLHYLSCVLCQAERAAREQAIMQSRSLETIEVVADPGVKPGTPANEAGMLSLHQSANDDLYWDYMLGK